MHFAFLPADCFIRAFFLMDSFKLLNPPFSAGLFSFFAVLHFILVH